MKEIQLEKSGLDKAREVWKEISTLSQATVHTQEESGSRRQVNDSSSCWGRSGVKKLKNGRAGVSIQ
jgi:hypothetical protein